MKPTKVKIAALCVIALSAGTAFAQSWPPAAVRIVVPYPPGTEPDVLARDIGMALSKQTGANFLVENRPGANAIIGTNEVVKSPGDGSVLLMVDRLAVATNPLLYSSLPYRWEEALKPVSDLARVNLFIGVRDNFPAKDYAEFIRYAKANPGKVTVATGGNGHVNHIGMAMVAHAHGLSFNYVPYRGVMPAVQDVLAGSVDAVMAGGLVMKTQSESKRMRVLVNGSEERMSVLPEVPALPEAGGVSGSIPSTVFSLFAPSSVPDAVVEHISGEVAKALQQNPQLVQTYTERGLAIAPSTPAQMLVQLQQEAQAYGRIIAEAGLKVE